MGNYKLDRMEVPVFWTVLSETNGHNSPLGTVFAVSDDHHSKGWMSLGYVSKQSPMGQGTFCGFPVEEVRQATMEEVLSALEMDHPHGKWFRPSNHKAMDASFHLVMSSAIGNWTADNATERDGSVLPVTKEQIQKYYDEAVLEHKALMSRWDEITSKQIDAIERSFGLNPGLKRFIDFVMETFGLK